MQFLSQTDAAAAKVDVLNVRIARLSDQSSQVAAAAVVDAASGNLGPSATSSDAELKKYGPILLGLTGANLLVACILAVIGTAQCVKRSGKSGSPTRSMKYARVQLEEEEFKGSDGYEAKRYSVTL